MKPLPPALKYAFLHNNRATLVVISDKLTESETRRLVAVLEKYRSVIEYSFQDLKGISPNLCTHRIPMEPEHKPSRGHQRRLNDVMREVVKKEILKLLHAGIIYPVQDSEWVSPVQVVPKKGAWQLSGMREMSSYLSGQSQDGECVSITGCSTRPPVQASHQ